MLKEKQLFDLLQQGLTLHQQGKFKEAQPIYEQVLRIQPNNFNALYLMGSLFAQTKRNLQAVELLKKTLQINPNHAVAYCNLGNVLSELRHLEDALINYNKAISLNPDFADAYNNRGIALEELKRLKDALVSYDKAINLNPDYAEAYNNRGSALAKLKRLDDALINYDKAISLNPDYADAYNNRGIALLELKHLEDALVSYDKAISLNPDFADAYNNRGIALEELKRLEDALVSYDKAISLNPDFADAYNNSGIALLELKHLEDALVNYDKAISLNPDFADAYNNRGIALSNIKRLEDALVSYDRALQLKPDIDYLLGNMMHAKMHLCDWRNFHSISIQLSEGIIKRERLINPFITLALIDNPELQKQSSDTFISDKHLIRNVLPKILKYPKHQKIRIGYFSADFHNHATMHLMVELFEHHDKSKFELVAFSFGPDVQDEWRKRAVSSFDQFKDVRNKSDIEVVTLARELMIDIAVDLKGFTQDSRLNIFAHRAAPIQVNYLGYPGTIGAAFMDYIIADSILIPEDKRKYYSEKIAYLPDSYQANIKKRQLSEKALTRKEVGLPKDAFVFCSFNNNYKITPSTFDSWMRILKSVEGSVLWLFKSNDTAVKNLKKEAESRGVDSERLFFASFIPVEEHLRRIQLADLFLDTHPYNAHTTASDALRIGLPIVTLMGESFASRVAASLLNVVDLPELITATQEDYESLAISLANNPTEIQKIKNKLEANLPNSDLYNIQKFTSNIEAAYQSMYQRYQNDSPPDHFYIN